MDKRILIVESDQKVSNLLARKLRETGLTAEITSTDQQALELLSRDHFQCAIIGFGFDQGTGLLIAEKIKKANIPIITLFVFEQSKEVAKAKTLGIGDIFFKTDFNVSHIIKKVFQKIKE